MGKWWGPGGREVKAPPPVQNRHTRGPNLASACLSTLVAVAIFPCLPADLPSSCWQGNGQGPIPCRCLPVLAELVFTRPGLIPIDHPSSPAHTTLAKVSGHLLARPCCIPSRNRLDSPPILWSPCVCAPEPSQLFPPFTSSLEGPVFTPPFVF